MVYRLSCKSFRGRCNVIVVVLKQRVNNYVLSIRPTFLLNTDRCLAGTLDGRVVLFKNGVLQASYQASTIREMDVTAKTDENRLSVVKLPKNAQQLQAVRICLALEFGLVLVFGDSNIYYLRKTDEGRR